MAKLYEALAEAFHAEGVDTQFVLMGDGNMHWSTAFAKLPGVHSVHVRHEHVTVAAATAYNVATGKVAVASVTCGPGVTQLMTALPAAARARLPMVVFAGEAPINAKFYNQAIDQAPLVTATGAKYIAAHSVPRMMDYVREAFHVAKSERCPVVLGIPYDLQKVEYMANAPYETSAMYHPKAGRVHPDPELVAEAVERLAAAKRPIIFGGRGVLWSGAREAVVRLADRCGALLSNTLPTRGLFHDHPYGLGIAGSYFSSLGREMFESADLVLAVGTSLSYYVGVGHFWGKSFKIQVDDAPRGLRDGQKAADLYVRSDARVGVEAILAGLDKKLGANKPTAATIRTKELAHRIATEPADAMPFDIEPGVLDPREVIKALDPVIPKDWDIVIGGGHQAYFNTQMRGRPADRYTTVREFGAVGNGLSYALGVAAARRQGRDGKVVLFEGDGGLLFHIQELETLKRQGYRILICAMNDGGYGSEFHKLRADGIDDSLALFGRPPLENIARGFGLRGHEIRDVSVIPKLFADFAAQGESEVWNIQISDTVTAPVIRQTIKRGHGNM
ncbi:MAG TPA: thiamine pyrophosphate-binding protein [Xanthobacteraceae bacterium]|jgi:thiamine pyrophosphate-dependent acetolactate synthase large subunit-like protein